MKEKKDIQQNINVTGSRNVKIIQAGGDVNKSKREQKVPYIEKKETIAGDSINKDAERLLKFIRGFKKPQREQSAGTYNDPQNQRIMGFIESEFTNTGKPLKILDYGCGKGSLITELINIKQFKTGSHQYIEQ